MSENVGIKQENNNAVCKYDNGFICFLLTKQYKAGSCSGRANNSLSLANKKKNARSPKNKSNELIKSLIKESIFHT